MSTSTQAAAGTLATFGGPVGASAAATIEFATLLYKLLNKNRHAELLRPNDANGNGGSFPGHNPDGTPIDGYGDLENDKYRFANYTDPQGVSHVPLNNLLAQLQIPQVSTSPQTPGFNGSANTPSATGGAPPAGQSGGGGGGGAKPPTPAGSNDDFLTQLNRILQQANGAAQAAGSIASLVPRPNESRQQAAGLQQNIQAITQQIESQVNSGEMDPEAALMALASLQQRVQSLSVNANPDLQRAAAIAGITVSAAIGNVTNKRTQSINAPITNGLQPGGVSQQQSQFGTAIRQRLATGTPGTAGPEAERLLAPKPKPSEMLPGLTAQINQQFPSVIGDEFGDKLRANLQKYLATPKVY